LRVAFTRVEAARMAYTGQISARQRMVASSGAMLAAAAVGVGFVTGLDLDVVRKVSEAITAVTIPAPRSPPRTVVPQKTPGEKESGKASPVNRHAKAAAIVAPKPKVPPPEPPPVTTASHAGTGSDASAGAAPAPGPGAGGRGNGTGAGGAGNGTGGGTRAVWRSGRIDDDDYPDAASRARVGGEVETRFTILPTGRVAGCRITLSSGDASLDATTCRLIEKRFRFRPATNAAGDPVPSQYGWRQSWWLERRR
jgi:protein TonB